MVYVYSKPDVELFN